LLRCPKELIYCDGRYTLQNKVTSTKHRDHLKNKYKPFRIILERRESRRPDHHKRMDITQIIVFCFIHLTQCPALDVQVKCASTHLQEQEVTIVQYLAHEKGSMHMLNCAT
jgi:hypothetical protein